MKSCLIVDDSQTIRKVTRRIFEDMFFSCREAENGEQARIECAKEMPDIIMLDWNMPIMSGIDFIKILRAMEGGTSPKVIFCTTENTMPFIQQALSSGADEYIMKPFDRMTIESKLLQFGILPEAV